MFIPLFIAILLGLVTPSANSQNVSQQGSTAVNVNSANSGDPNDPNNPSDPGTGNLDDDGDTGGGDDTGGEGSHTPPKKHNRAHAHL